MKQPILHMKLKNNFWYMILAIRYAVMRNKHSLYPPCIFLKKKDWAADISPFSKWNGLISCPDPPITIIQKCMSPFCHMGLLMMRSIIGHDVVLLTAQ